MARPARVSLVVWLALICSLVWLGSARACKYSVRDVAFCQLDAAPYRLTILTGPDLPAEWVETLPELGRELLRRTNIRLKVVARDAASEDLERERAVAPGPGTACVLTAPDGRTRLIELTDSQGQVTRGSLEAAINRVASSKLREELIGRMLQVHSILLMVEGTDPDSNTVARQAIEEAVAETERTLDFLPKPIAHPPLPIVLGRDRLAAEALTLWSLGLDPEAEQAQIVVLLGRGRKLGEVIRVGEHQPKELIKYLSLVGQDCECGLDRSWMQGMMIPHRWTRLDEGQAMKALGFDPGNPLVTAEMRLILARGPSYRGPGAAGLASADDLLSGYTEFDLSGMPVDPEQGETNIGQADTGQADASEPIAPNEDLSQAKADLDRSDEEAAAGSTATLTANPGPGASAGADRDDAEPAPIIGLDEGEPTPAVNGLMIASALGVLVASLGCGVIIFVIRKGAA